MSTQIRNRSTFVEVLRGGLIATLLSILFVLMFALVARLFSLSNVISPAVNQVIKVLSVFVAVLICIKSDKLGFLKGLLVGVVFVLVSSVLYCILGGSFDMNSLLIDLGISCGVGIVAGIIAVNRKK